MSVRYKEFKYLNLPSIEKETLERWKVQQAFEKSVSLREGAQPFVFYEGPPSANGLPGIHHVISRTLKDLVCRYKTMQGYQVQRKGGWDTHGLPVELGVEKELGITKEDIGKKISVAEYNQKCREAVLRYKDKWDDLTTKMGYWVDLKDPYITFTNEYIESLWWCLKQLYNKGLLYKSVSIQPYSPGAGTGLSSHELNQPGTYKMVKDTSATVLFKAAPLIPRWGKLADALRPLAEIQEKGEDIFFMAWTTTPWTLPSNLGLTVGPNIDYVLVKTFNPYTHEPQNVILAKALVPKYFKAEGENGDFEQYAEQRSLPTGEGRGGAVPWKIIAEFKGKDIENVEYEQLLPYEASSLKAIREITPDAKPFRILLGDFVTTEDGTGIVHTAPAFGADDFRVGKKYNIGILTLVDREGKFVDGLGEFSGRYIKDYKGEHGYVDVNVDISVKLKKEGRAFKVEKYEHSYPHCWRTDKPVVYYPLDAWFIRTTALRDRMVELNKTINWKPASTGTGRFGNWLENMVDWNLSRSRYWGTPLPIWRTEDGSEEKCIGSIEELNAEIRKASEVLGGDVNKNYLHDGILDLHKPYVDEVVLVSESGKPMRREPDLIDVWFDSGAMPYAQWGLPNPSGGGGAVSAGQMISWVMLKEGKISQKEFETFYNQPIDKDAESAQSSLPTGEGWGGADFIAEGVDQTRGWFYTLHALGVMLFDSVAYKTVVSNGLVLDKDGNKMSKRLGNVVDPFQTIEQFGADATRWYLITNASPWDNLKFNLEGIKEVQRKFFGTLYNTYQFFALYANVDGFTFKEEYIPVEQRPEIDRWILSSLQTLIKKVSAAFDEYEPTVAGRLIEDFVDEHLSNWYVRLCRRRFWKGDYEGDKIAAYQTLYECLETVVKLMAPISPFFSDELFLNLNAVTGLEKEASVHHARFPVAKEELIDTPLEERMTLAQDASSLILSLRKKADIKVRQPLQKVLIPVLNGAMEQQLRRVEDLIKAEVNVKELEYLTDTEGFIKKKIKPNFSALGKKLGPKMKAVSTALSNFNQHDISLFEKEGRYSIPVDNGESVELSLSEVEISSEDIPGWSVASKGPLTVALDINVTPELAQEGDAREFVNRIQKIRKDSGFDVTDRIEVKIAAGNGINEALAKFNNYICAEILADKLEFTSDIDGGTEIELNDKALKVIVFKRGKPYGNKKGAPAKATAKGAKTAKPAAKAPVKKVAEKAAAKPAAKSTAAKKTATPANKAAAKSTTSAKAPAKAAKPAAAKPAAKKAAPAKPAPKAAAKPAPKTAAAPAKKTSTKAVPAAKKVAPAKPAPKAAEPVKKPAITAPSKEETKTATKPLEKKATRPAAKPEPAKPVKVVIPKTSTTNSVKYQPDFTRSVLDTPAANQETQGPTMRYSDAELMEFRELINKKLDTAKKELAYLQGLITRRDESGDLDEGRYMTMEDGSMSMEREQLSQMASRQIQFIDHLEKALMRIENKTYGVCRVTGKLIDKARLRAVPHATLSIEAKQMRTR